MPEGPECTVIANSLSSLLKNKEIINLEIINGRYLKNKLEGLEKFKNNLPMKIYDVKKKGKLIYFIFEKDNKKYYLLNTLGMSGKWLKGKRYEKHSSIHLYYDRGCITFDDLRHFGTLKFLFSDKELENKLINIGPDVLSNDFITKENFIKRVRKHNNWDLPKILMNQKIISGIGNYLKAEILYETKINPFTKTKDISDKILYNLYENILKICFSSLKSKGVSLRHYSDLDGKLGDFEFKLKVYNKKKDKFGNKVIKSATSDKRVTHWVKEIQVY